MILARRSRGASAPGFPILQIGSEGAIARSVSNAWSRALWVNAQTAMRQPAPPSTDNTVASRRVLPVALPSRCDSVSIASSPAVGTVSISWLVNA